MKIRERTTFLITTFHPYFRECDKIVSRNWDLLDKSGSTRPLLKLDLIKGIRRDKNLRDILVRGRLLRSKPRGEPPARVGTAATNYCSKPHCQYCKILNRSGRITSVVTDKEYNTRLKVTCRSNNLIYCLCCKTYTFVAGILTNLTMMDQNPL